ARRGGTPRSGGVHRRKRRSEAAGVRVVAGARRKFARKLAPAFAGAAMTALLDSSILLDYLCGDARAARVIDSRQPAAITAVTWLEIMALAPSEQRDATRAFLRSFERLSISEPVADEADRLLRAHPALKFHQAIAWATASLNRLAYVTADAQNLP